MTPASYSLKRNSGDASWLGLGLDTPWTWIPERHANVDAVAGDATGSASAVMDEPCTVRVESMALRNVVAFSVEDSVPALFCHAETEVKSAVIDDMTAKGYNAGKAIFFWKFARHNYERMEVVVRLKKVTKVRFRYMRWQRRAWRRFGKYSATMSMTTQGKFLLSRGNLSRDAETTFQGSSERPTQNIAYRAMW